MNCKHCEHFELDAGQAVCLKGHSATMDCDGKDFEIDVDMLINSCVNGIQWKYSVWEDLENN